MIGPTYSAWSDRDIDNVPDKEDRLPRIRCRHCGAFLSWSRVECVKEPDEPDRFVGTEHWIQGRPGAEIARIICRKCKEIGWEERS